MEIQCINEDYKATFDKQMQMHEEFIELKETIETIKNDLSKKDEEILKILIKMRQVDMEKDRLEQEYQQIKKLIGKQTRGKNA